MRLIIALAALLSTAIYLRGARRMHARWWEVAAFFAGWAAVIVALLSRVDALADILFSAHMTQHELLMMVAAPLIVLGRPLIAAAYALPPRYLRFARAPMVINTWRAMTGPIVVLVMHAVVLWSWHVPTAFEFALRHEWIHSIQHLMFFVTAALFWWSLIHGRYGRVGYGAAVFFVFVTSMHTGLLGAAFTFGNRIWYPMHAHRTAAAHVNPLDDQQLAGLIMWVPAGMIFTIVALALFAAWLGEMERRVRIAENERVKLSPP